MNPVFQDTRYGELLVSQIRYTKDYTGPAGIYSYDDKSAKEEYLITTISNPQLMGRIIIWEP
ncbi:MAG: hypothetical protein CM15mP64_5150 [Candidatus Neomarinimicrobiota bacterium]|nr:MAG: hypothetical protein CM15mP64_5150 [Candidatus Neomarinimicrobiota bacterium]